MVGRQPLPLRPALLLHRLAVVDQLLADPLNFGLRLTPHCLDLVQLCPPGGLQGCRLGLDLLPLGGLPPRKRFLMLFEGRLAGVELQGQLLELFLTPGQAFVPLLDPQTVLGQRRVMLVPPPLQLLFPFGKLL